MDMALNEQLDSFEHQTLSHDDPKSRLAIDPQLQKRLKFTGNIEDYSTFLLSFFLFSLSPLNLHKQVIVL